MIIVLLYQIQFKIDQIQFKIDQIQFNIYKIHDFLII